MTIDLLSQISGLDTETGKTNCMDDEALYLSIVDMYKQQLQQDLPKLQQQYSAQEWLEFSRTCHGLKGASASVGAFEIQQLSAELELAGKNGDTSVILAKAEEYFTTLETMINAL